MSKYSKEQKVQASISYLAGEKSALQIAFQLGMIKYGDKLLNLV